jgi:putative salt-induced outer membrane protein YdiY
MRVRLTLTLMVSVCITAACSSTPSPSVDPATSGAAPGTSTASGEIEAPFAPTVPEPKKFDWIRLTSGEWLKGNLTVLRERSLEFDSDELNDLEIDWEKVAEFRSARKNSILIDDGDRGKGYTGILNITKDSISIVTDNGKQQFDRKDLLVIVPGNLSESNYWDGTLSLGISGKAGNVNQKDISLYALLRRRTLENRFVTTYNGAYGTVEGEDTVDNHRLNSRFDLFLGRQLYVTPLTIDYYRNLFTNIDHQLTPAAQVGYHLVDDSKVNWDVEAGLGYRYTKFASVEEDEDSSEGTAAFVGGTTFNWDITSDIELHLDYQLQVGLPDTSDTNQFAFLTLSIDLFGDLDLDLSLTWNRVGEPRPAANGTTPKNDDLRYTVGLGWDF